MFRCHWFGYAHHHWASLYHKSLGTILRTSHVEGRVQVKLYLSFSFNALSFLLRTKFSLKILSCNLIKALLFSSAYVMSKVNIYFVCELTKGIKWATTWNRFINQQIITTSHLGKKIYKKYKSVQLTWIYNWK